jgi:hypothetical protein
MNQRPQWPTTCRLPMQHEGQLVGRSGRGGDNVDEAATGHFPAVRTPIAANVRFHFQRMRAPDPQRTVDRAPRNRQLPGYSGRSLLRVAQQVISGCGLSSACARALVRTSAFRPPGFTRAHGRSNTRPKARRLSTYRCACAACSSANTRSMTTLNSPRATVSNISCT